MDVCVPEVGLNMVSSATLSIKKSRSRKKRVIKIKKCLCKGEEGKHNEKQKNFVVKM